MFKHPLAAALLAAPFVAIAPVQAEAQEGDIVAVAQAAGSFGTLLQAATAADLVAVLQSEGPFTIFAPTDEAFAKIPEGQLNALLQDKEALRQVLLNHVLPGRIGADEVVNLDTAETAAGQQLGIRVENGTVKIDEANVVATDIEATNGVIHVIDQVILPGM